MEETPIFCCGENVQVKKRKVCLPKCRKQLKFSKMSRRKKEYSFSETLKEINGLFVVRPSLFSRHSLSILNLKLLY